MNASPSASPRSLLDAGHLVGAALLSATLVAGAAMTAASLVAASVGDSLDGPSITLASPGPMRHAAMDLEPIRTGGAD